jgi:hypothetical protein
MNKKVFITTLTIAIFSIVSVSLHAQRNVNNQPDWGPSGYNYARYYYIPEINIYYEVTSGLYVYLSGNIWVKRHSLPSKYKKFNLYETYKAVINDKDPWSKHIRYRKRYAKYGNMHDKYPSLRDSRNQDNNHDDRKNNYHGNQNGGRDGDNHNNSGNRRNNHQENRNNNRSNNQNNGQGGNKYNNQGNSTDKQ